MSDLGRGSPEQNLGTERFSVGCHVMGSRENLGYASMT